MGFFKKAIGKLSQDEGERRAATVRDWAEGQSGCTLINDAQPRQTARVAGIVEGIRVRPREGVPAIEAVITDGSGSVTAVWLGRRVLPGLQLGRRIIVEGRFGGDPKSLQIMNPRYEFAGAQQVD
ncbi:MAG: OB-fold nucleic acid binding domain-containing protein [Actinomycetota bacterium]